MKNAYNQHRKSLRDKSHLTCDLLNLLNDDDLTDAFFLAMVDELTDRGEIITGYMGRIMKARMNMIEEFGEEFTNEFDKEFEIEQMPAKQTFRDKVISFTNVLIRNRAIWYIAGAADGVLILGALNHYFHFLG